MESQEEKSRKRDFFRFGKKDDTKKKDINGGLRPVSPLTGLDAKPGSPRNSPYRATASPRTHSPASSMIFERSVQEDVAVAQASPQIPSHIITENHIPPALDATSEAITDRKLDPDSVEIVTHSAHQPAAVTITEGFDAPISPIMSEESHLKPDGDNLSNYANLDSVDVRRLSFISFADVVHGEHDSEVRRDSAITSHPNIGAPRSPSPFRSPVSSAAMGTSPPTSVSPSVHEASPHRAPLGDLNVETMRQALRKTGSGDLSNFRSPPLSAVGNDEGKAEKSFK